VYAIYTGRECQTSSCTASYYCSNATLSCVPCPASSTSGPGAYTCSCNSGYTAFGYGTGLQCLYSPCAAGAYYSISLSSCMSCPSGSYSVAGAYTCKCYSSGNLASFGSGDSLSCFLSTSNTCPNATTALKADHQLYPNPLGSYAVGAAIGSTLKDTGSSSTPYPITAGTGVTYNGHALQFDGTSNAWVSFGSGVTFGSSSFSISVWATYSSFGSSGYGRIFDFESISTGATLYVSHSGTTSALYAGVYGVNPTFPATAKWTLNQFSHVAVVCSYPSPSTCSVYFNGLIASTVSVTMTSMVFSYVAGLGKPAAASTDYFQGQLADLRLYSRALTSGNPPIS